MLTEIFIFFFRNDKKRLIVTIKSFQKNLLDSDFYNLNKRCDRQVFLSSVVLRFQEEGVKQFN